MDYEYLYLGLGQLEIDWSKHSVQKDHTILFNDSDKKKIPYYYSDGDEEIAKKTKLGYGKKLIEVRDRLNLLGYTFQALSGLLKDEFSYIPYEIPELKALDTQAFIDALASIDVNQIKLDEHEGDVSPGEFLKRRILSLTEFAEINKLINKTNSFHHYLFEQIDPCIILAALANNPKNHNTELCLRTSDYITPLARQQKYLIVTEGKTDVAVIQKAMEVLKPGIADFFDYLDMEENYPFGGVGNLCKFFTGLTRIGTERKIIFIFDNDAQGQAGLLTVGKISKPDNFITMAYPSLQDFTKFKTLGPTGQTKQDVNKGAVAIEMFLDLSYNTNVQPMVQWSSFESQTKTYQGALINKEKYQKTFIDLKKPDYSKYNFTKLNLMLDHLVQTITN